jgi:transcriptional regulator with XRE-family HTH domain
MTNMEFYRRYRGLSQDGVARRVGITQQYYARLEKRTQTNCSQNILRKIAVLLMIDVANLAELFEDYVDSKTLPNTN